MLKKYNLGFLDYNDLEKGSFIIFVGLFISIFICLKVFFFIIFIFLKYLLCNFICLFNV